ncbi:MAG: putative baseplate assembly protein [bacterium]
MSESTLTCQDEQRRDEVRRNKNLNGLDYLEVSEDQLTLAVYFLDKAPEYIGKENVSLIGGRRIRDIQVVDIRLCRQDDAERDDCMTVFVDKPGDFSTYKLCIVAAEDGRPTDQRHPDFDPRYACLDFTFKAGCPSDLDCKPQAICPPEKYAEPEINYLAKDYASFRQLILDRLALLMPDWQERHVPDLGITLVELLAYVGDHLSYYQDAVATEAYLDTARQRISVRRHTRLVDYPMHEGCNARAWVWVETSANTGALKPSDFYFITHYDEALVSGQPLNADDLRNVPAGRYEVFEPLVADRTQTIQFYEAHNAISFYTWGDRECCLPRGTTRATLKDGPPISTPAPQQEYEDYGQKRKYKEPSPPEPERKLDLQVGDVLIFEEVLGPNTGNPADADPIHRHVVRLTQVKQDIDTLYNQPVVEIEWAAEHALPFPLCLSAIGEAPECKYLGEISVARGNVILVDHGRTMEPPEELGKVPIGRTAAQCECEGMPGDTMVVAGRFRPYLQKAPLTFCQPLPRMDTPASRLLMQATHAALPQIYLVSIPAAPDGESALFQWQDLKDPTSLAKRLKYSTDLSSQHLRGQLSAETQKNLEAYDGTSELPEVLRTTLMKELKRLLQTWSPRRDLLASGPNDRDFVIEMDDDGRGHLRFGDGELGRKAKSGTTFFATYRVGNGPPGNVGAETIAHLVLRHTTLSGVTLRPHNPFPAQGGTSPEPLAEVKLYAPHTFRKELRRAITADDYARIAERNAKLQRAAASLRWTGSWYEAGVAIDPVGTEEASDALFRKIAGYLYRYRRMGHDLVVNAANYVPLEIVMKVCVLPHYLRGHVEAELLNVFGNRVLPNGRRGFFHPDTLTFGEGVYLSKLIAAAQAVTGVESVEITNLQRYGEAPNDEIKNGILPLSPFEIAQLDNDPSFPEHGQFTLVMNGGR